MTEYHNQAKSSLVGNASVLTEIHAEETSACVSVDPVENRRKMANPATLFPPKIWIGFAIDPTATVQADPTTKQVNIDTQAFQAAIESAITAAGYQVA